MADSAELDATWLHSTLLTAVVDLRRAADVFAQHGALNLDTKCFYYTLFLRCWKAQRLLNEVTKPDHIRGFMHDALQRLESLVAAAPLASCTLQHDEIFTFYGLQQLNHTLDRRFDGAHSKLVALQDCVTFENQDKQTALLKLLSSIHTVALKSNAKIDSFVSELATPKKSRVKPPDGVRSAAESLFKVLKAKRECACEPGHTYVLQLLLETHRSEFNGHDFGLYFGMEQVWQEAQVHTNTHPRTLNEPSTPSNDSEDPSRSMRRQGRRRRVDKLCEDIRKIAQSFPTYRLKLRLEEDCLWKFRSEESNLVIDKSKDPVSLAQLLKKESHFLNERIKRILSVVLSYAVLHLHETSWLSPWWSSRNVMFFETFEGLPIRPYIKAELDDDATDRRIPLSPTDEDGDDIDPDDLLLPPYPCLIGLATVLIEVHKAASIKLLQKPMFLMIRDLFRYYNNDFTDQTRMAIKACLDPNIGLGNDGRILNDAGVQKVIYERIVSRLEDELEQGFSDVAVDNLDDLIQRLDLANGGQPIHETRRYGVVRSSSAGILTRSFNKLEASRGVQSQSSTTNMVGKLSERIDLPPKTSHISNDPGERLGEQSKSANQSISSSLTFDETGRGFVIPLMPIRPSLIRPDTLRVMNIPDDMSKSNLAIKLEHSVGSKCIIHSLARGSRDARWKKHATVTFPRLPNSTLSDTLQKLQDQVLEDHLEFDKSFHGLTPLYDEGESAILDIIAIEGLGTNPFGTFRAPSGDLMWLRDFLPHSFPSCRILLYGYDSKVPDSKSNQSVPEIASTCKNFVMNFRRMTKTDGRPIVWLGQSMGGLIVQEVLVQAHQHRSQRTSGNLSDQTIGFLGYGVPTNGLRNESLLNSVKKQPNFEMIRSICLEGDRPSRYLQNLANRFALCNERISVHHFYETNPSPDIWDPEAAPERRVDDQEVIGREDRYWVPRNHSELVKVPNRADFVYTTTVQIISLILERQIPDAK